jgi:hypothetical protein
MYLTQNASMALLFSLRNTTMVVDRHIAQRMCSPPADNEFIGMADYLMESIIDLLTLDSESIFDSGLSRGRYHPSRKCFTVDVADDALREETLMEPSRVLVTGTRLLTLVPRRQARRTQGSCLICGWSG